MLRDENDDLQLRLKLQAATQQRTENALKEVKAQLVRHSCCGFLLACVVFSPSLWLLALPDTPAAAASQDEVLRSRNEASEKALMREKVIERSLVEAQEVNKQPSVLFALALVELSLPVLAHSVLNCMPTRRSLHATRAASKRMRWFAGT